MQVKMSKLIKIFGAIDDYRRSSNDIDYETDINVFPSYTNEESDKILLICEILKWKTPADGSIIDVQNAIRSRLKFFGVEVINFNQTESPLNFDIVVDRNSFEDLRLLLKLKLCDISKLR
jgi:hypothetical protein